MKFPNVPSGPLTLALNGFIMDLALNEFHLKFLPAFEIEITSGYRTPAKNEEVKGSFSSAHMYNLARDFVLKNKSGYLSAGQLERVYNEFVKPNWKGFSYYNPPKTGKTGWIHVNLDREITNRTKMAEYSVTGIGLIWGLRKFINQIKKRKGYDRK